MSLTRFHWIVMGAWFTAVVLTVVVRISWGLPLSAWEVVAAFGVALAPAPIIMMVFRGAPPQTIAEVLYDAEHTKNPIRERLIADVRNDA